MANGKMEREQVLKALRDIQDMEDHEFAHIMADGFLLRYIDDKDIAQAFNAIHKWYA